MTFIARIQFTMRFFVELKGRCSIQLSYGRIWIKRKTGRGREIRTPDILLPKQARYQTALYPGLWSCSPEQSYCLNLLWSRGAEYTDKLALGQPVNIDRSVRMAAILVLVNGSFLFLVYGFDGWQWEALFRYVVALIGFQEGYGKQVGENQSVHQRIP